MGNVIDKTFAILELIVSSSPKPMLPTQLAEELGLNRATCSRLLKQLMDMGYILKISRQQGYVPGPKLLTMSNIAGFQQEFLNHAIPVIDHCAEVLQTSVLTAQIYHGKRYVLYHKNRNHDLDIRITQPCFNDIFETATGILLIAHRGKEERLVCYRNGSQTQYLSGFSTEKEMQKTLDQVKKKDIFTCEKEYQRIYACPVMRNGIVFAALGASITPEQYSAAYHKKIIRTLQSAAQEITEKSTRKYTIG